MITENNKEIEIKLPIANIPALISQLLSLGFKNISNRTHEFNIVFDTLDGQLKNKNQLLRLRKKGDVAWITFKQPLSLTPDDLTYKIRDETEIIVSEFNKAQTILLNLGYHIFFIYEKYQEIYKKDDILVMIDQTPIGDFIEIEGSPIDIDKTSERLGYLKSQYIVESYYSLFRKVEKKGHMLFK